MTINQLVYNIKNTLKIARPDNPILSDRQVEFMINYFREKILVQHLEKKRSISSNIKQDLGQVPVQKVDRNDGTIVTNKNIFRTSVQLPQPIELDQEDLFTYIGGLDKQSPIPYKTKANVKWNKHNKYASKEPLAYYNNGYIYITNCANPQLKYVNIEGVFLNPREVHKFKNPDGTPCYNPDTDDYPLSGRFVDMIDELIKSKELNIFMQIQEDTTNNADVKS